MKSDQFSRDVMHVCVLLNETGVDRETLARILSERIKASTEVTPDRIEFEDPEAEAEFLTKLFAKNGVKAKYIVDLRSVQNV